MPSSVENAAPTTVLTARLARSFIRSQELAVHENDYRDGTSHGARLVDAPRRRWRLTKRLTPAQLQELQGFHIARMSPTEPPYFCDPYETNPRFAYVGLETSTARPGDSSAGIAQR